MTVIVILLQRSTAKFLPPLPQRRRSIGTLCFGASVRRLEGAQK